MPDAASAQPSKCAACGVSLADTPFVTDKKGRGVCKPCVAKIKAKKQRAAESGAGAPPQAAPAAAGIPLAEDGEADVMGALLADSAASTKKPCPECQSYIDPESVVCVHCGYNESTGKQMRTRFIAAPKEKEAKEGGGVSLQMSPSTVGVLVGVGCAAPTLFGFLDPGLAALGLFVAAGINSLLSLTLFVITLIDGHLKWTLVMVLCGGIGQLLYALGPCERPMVGASWLGSLVGLIVSVIVFVAIGPELETVGP